MRLWTYTAGAMTPIVDSLSAARATPAALDTTTSADANSRFAWTRGTGSIVYRASNSGLLGGNA